MSSGDALVILGRASYNDREAEASFTECLSESVGEGRNPLRVVSESEFKDLMYPWFEPRTAPTNVDELVKLFAQPGVRDQVETNQVRYIAWINGDTVTTGKGGRLAGTLSAVGGGCFGVSFWEQDASYEASIWDLENMTSAGAISADATGTSYLAGVILPIPLVARPGNAACKALATQLKEFLLTEES